MDVPTDAAVIDEATAAGLPERRFVLSARRCESQASRREGSREWKEASGRGLWVLVRVVWGGLPLL